MTGRSVRCQSHLKPWPLPHLPRLHLPSSPTSLSATYISLDLAYLVSQLWLTFASELVFWSTLNNCSLKFIQQFKYISSFTDWDDAWHGNKIFKWFWKNLKYLNFAFSVWLKIVSLYFIILYTKIKTRPEKLNFCSSYHWLYLTLGLAAVSFIKFAQPKVVMHNTLLCNMLLTCFFFFF